MNARQIRKMVRDVAEAAHPKLRQELASEKQSILAEERARVDAELAETAREAEEHWKRLTGEELKGRLPEMSSWERSKLAARRVAGVLFTVVDIPLSAWLWVSALVIDVITAFTIGAMVSIGVAVATHLSLLNFADDPERPLRSIRICRSTALTASLVLLAAAFVLFFMRTASPEMGPIASLLILLVPGGLWLTSISLPVLAGALFAWAGFQGRPWWYRKAIERRQRHIFVINQALKKIASLCGSSVDPTTTETAGGNTTRSESPLVALENGRNGGLPLALVLFAFSMTASEIHAQEISRRLVEEPQSRSAQAGVAKLPLSEPSCELWDDESSSVSQEDRAQALRRMEDLLGLFTKTLGCRRLRIGHFTNEGSYAKFAEFDLPTSPSLNCTRLQSKYASVFRLFEQVESQKSEQKCASQRQAADRVFENERAATLGKAQATLLNREKKLQRTETCTDITGLVKGRLQMASDPTLILVFTDGVSDCQSELRYFEISHNVRVIFLSLPADPKRVARNRSEEWMKMWATAAPDVTVVPWVNWTPSWIQRLPRSLAIQNGAVAGGTK